jgi:transcriptional regulator with XRE-family HTH domain
MARKKITKEDIQPTIITLGKIIRQVRETREMSQADLAFAAKVHPSYVGLLERGDINPSLYILLQIAQALDVSLSDWIREIEKKG